MSFKILCIFNLIGIISGQHHWETAIFASDNWKYTIPVSEPSSNWKTIDFDDSDWSYDDAVKDVMLPVPSGSLKALVDAGWKYHCNETDQTLEGEEEGAHWSNLLIRDLRSDMLPGKCHRLDPISPSSIHGKSS